MTDSNFNIETLGKSLDGLEGSLFLIKTNLASFILQGKPDCLNQRFVTQRKDSSVGNDIWCVRTKDILLYLKKSTLEKGYHCFEFLTVGFSKPIVIGILSFRRNAETPFTIHDFEIFNPKDKKFITVV